MASGSQAPSLYLVKGQGVKQPPSLSLERHQYRQRIELYAERIRRTSDPDEIIGVLDQAVRETRALHDQEPAFEARRRAAEAERQIKALRAELDLVTALLREDPLTGALNRRGLCEGFERELSRTERQGAELSVVLLDLDNFKKLNDGYGHTTGDRALAHLTQVARKTLRPSDQFGRYGGEEFVAVLPEAGIDEAQACALRLQAALAGAPLEVAGGALPLTFSAGVARCRDQETFEQCLERADAALYAAKRAGKNRVKIAD